MGGRAALVKTIKASQEMYTILHHGKASCLIIFHEKRLCTAKYDFTSFSGRSKSWLILSNYSILTGPNPRCCALPGIGTTSGNFRRMNGKLISGRLWNLLWRRRAAMVVERFLIFNSPQDLPVVKQLDRGRVNFLIKILSAGNHTMTVWMRQGFDLLV